MKGEKSYQTPKPERVWEQSTQNRYGWRGANPCKVIVCSYSVRGIRRGDSRKSPPSRERRHCRNTIRSHQLVEAVRKCGLGISPPNPGSTWTHTYCARKAHDAPRHITALNLKGMEQCSKSQHVNAQRQGFGQFRIGPDKIGRRRLSQ